MASKYYTVPADQRREYNNLVARANANIKRSLEFIQQEQIESDATRRALLHDYVSPVEWAGQKAVFSRSVRFNSEKEYEQTKRHLSKWGDNTVAIKKDDKIVGYAPENSVEGKRQEYIDAITNTLTRVAIANTDGVLTKGGKLPGQLKKKISSLTLEQMTHFFDNDPTDAVEENRFDSLTYMGADEDEFVSITEAHLDALKELYPKAHLKAMKEAEPKLANKSFKEIDKIYKKRQSDARYRANKRKKAKKKRKRRNKKRKKK